MTARSRLSVGLTILGIGVLVCLYQGYLTLRDADRAERHLHAVITTTKIICIYLQDNESVPSSWDDLSRVDLRSNSGSMFSWPRDFEYIKSVVTIDFTRSMEELAAGHVDSYVTCKEPVYSYDRYLSDIVNIANKVMSRHRGSTQR